MLQRTAVPSSKEKSDLSSSVAHNETKSGVTYEITVLAEKSR